MPRKYLLVSILTFIATPKNYEQMIYTPNIFAHAGLIFFLATARSHVERVNGPCTTSTSCRRI